MEHGRLNRGEKKYSTQFHLAIKKNLNELRTALNSQPPTHSKINREEPTLHILKGAEVKDGIIIVIIMQIKY